MSRTVDILLQIQRVGLVLIGPTLDQCISVARGGILGIIAGLQYGETDND